MSTHTPGPWTISDLDPRVVGAVRLVRFQVAGQDVPQLQAVARVMERTGETDANARLIAAAPELLKATRAAWHAIQSLLAVRDGIPDESLKSLGDFLKRVVVKAEGR